MATLPNTPKILERKEAIVLDRLIECHCGRTKERPHCPECGRTKLYGMADTTPALDPDGNVIKGCKVYRCVACAEKFNDADWYFRCHAPIKIDWEATRKKIKEDKKKENQQKWLNRIKAGERFDYNDRKKCKSETDFDPEEMRVLVMHGLQKLKEQS